MMGQGGQRRYVPTFISQTMNGMSSLAKGLPNVLLILTTDPHYWRRGYALVQNMSHS